MKSIVVAALVFLSFSAFSQSFKSGNAFLATPLYGEVHVNCRDISTGEQKFAIFQCQDLRLFPVEYDFFKGPNENIDADHVQLSCVQPDGKKVVKTSGYKDGMSDSRFNLWITSLFQQPLLDEGLNKVEYQLLKGDEVKMTGSFDVQINRGQTINCPRGFIDSTNLTDCVSPYSACQQFFSHSNYCR